MAGEHSYERLVNSAWLTALLTSTGTNAPKNFPKSPDDLLKKRGVVEEVMNPKQWLGIIKHLTGGNKAKKPKKRE
ncbi:hypothetical protein GR212_15325 [Rhizobium lusitanum]|uniref:Uncharacterized protein n=1 Tax=Rhizobium lusitanum TaxID=293958 RepID=A0A6L9U6P6_9HYPH|nr:hypothetical protein [Rhizobium lusitanum]NEI70954.1 hypothetical protein [Rhizobium lusitanum]